MIVSDNKNFIYARIPKTGSTSVSQALEPFRRRQDRSIAGTIVRKLTPGFRHSMSTNFRAHPHWPLRAAKLVLPENIFSSAFKFSVVRHPVSWCRSLFNHIMKNTDNERFSELYADVHNHKSFDKFVESLLLRPVPPQVGMLVDLDGRVLADGFARLENLDVEITTIFERIGIATRIDRLNTGEYSSGSQVSDETRAIIEEVFKPDYLSFGYGSEIGSFSGDCVFNEHESLQNIGRWIAANGDGCDYTAFQRDESYSQRKMEEQWFQH